jgi:hypothetical protein
MSSLPKRTRLPMTDKQKQARLANLEKGRIKRMTSLKQKKESPKKVEFDLSDSDSGYDLSSDSDSDAFVISKKKPAKIKKSHVSAHKPMTEQPASKQDFETLTSIMLQMAKQQSKVLKAKKTRKSGGTNLSINMAPPVVQEPVKSSHNLHLDETFRVLGMKK